MATQQELIEEQFAQATKGLAQKRKQAEEEALMGVNRQAAMGGLTGGGAIKAKQKAQQGLEDVFGGQMTQLEGQKAAASQAAQAQKEQQEFASEEAAKQRLFTAGESALTRGQQQQQFESAFGLQNKQFDESRRQFDEQLKYQLKEFTENQITNFINAMTAFDKAGLGDANKFNQLAAAINRVRGMDAFQYSLGGNGTTEKVIQ